MNENNQWARRYHWLSSTLEDLVCEPHHAICSDCSGQILNMVVVESGEAPRVSTGLSQERPESILEEVKRLQSLDMPGRHHFLLVDLRPNHLHKALHKNYDRKPRDSGDL